MNVALAIGLVAMVSRAAPGAEATEAPLVLEAKLSLGDVRGRLDHLGVDVARQRLYVAELGNDSVGVVDLETGRLAGTIGGLSEPQGIGYEQASDTVYVANGGDGTVRLFRGSDLKPVGRIELGRDADNVRVDATLHRVIVGHDDGALAVIDPQTRKVIASISLAAHPESFQLDVNGRRAYINVPNAHEIAVVDLATLKFAVSWQTGKYTSNYPMSLDSVRQVLWVVFRSPPKLVAFDPKTAAPITALDSCADADDVFVDTRRDRLYVSCGAGFIDAWGRSDAAYVKLASIATAVGARTSLFIPELDRLYLAVRATASEPAALWVFRASLAAKLQSSHGANAKVIVFVCDHGVAKSALAAALFNDMAAKRGLSLRAERRAADAPQQEPSLSTNKGLAADGLPIPKGIPERLSAQDVHNALRVVTLGISRPIPGAEGKSEDWADVPMVGDGYPAARDAMSRHISQLIDALTTRPQ